MMLRRTTWYIPCTIGAPYHTIRKETRNIVSSSVTPRTPTSGSVEGSAPKTARPTSTIRPILVLYHSLLSYKTIPSLLPLRLYHSLTQLAEWNIELPAHQVYYIYQIYVWAAAAVNQENLRRIMCLCIYISSKYTKIRASISLFSCKKQRRKVFFFKYK